jgi:glycosyltransferase involved in cell wall biosynthesis
MKVNHFNSNDTRGGAAKIAFNLVGALSSLDVDAKLYVQTKSTGSELVHCTQNIFSNVCTYVSMYFDLAPLIFYPRWNHEPFYSNRIMDFINIIQDSSIDIIHLHNITRGFIKLESLARVKKPIIWTLHDTWPFTGGCTSLYNDCDRFKTRCGVCPALGSSQNNDLSYRNWIRKRDAYSGKELTLVCPSESMANSARSSSLFKNVNIEIISHGINLDIFRPKEKNEARSLLKLNSNMNYLLYGANYFHRDKNKGFQYFVESLKYLDADIKNNMVILIFGSNTRVKNKYYDIPVIDYGYIDDDYKISLLYSAATITIVPSKRESFGLIPIESMACGTPVVCFDIPAINENVINKFSGYLAKPFNPQDIAHGIMWLLEDKNRYNAIIQNGIDAVKNKYSLINMTKNYLALYQQLLKSGR